MATLTPLAQQRCLNHGNREAAGRCPSCQRFFCRECITDHENKVICKSCLEVELTESEEKTSLWSGQISGWAGVILGISIAWFFFLLLGSLLLKIPSSFHDSLFIQ